MYMLHSINVYQYLGLATLLLLRIYRQGKKHAAYHRLIVIFHVNCAVDNRERYGGKASLVFSFKELVTVQYGEFVYTVNIELNL